MQKLKTLLFNMLYTNALYLTALQNLRCSERELAHEVIQEYITVAE